MRMNKCFKQLRPLNKVTPLSSRIPQKRNKNSFKQRLPKKRRACWRLWYSRTTQVYCIIVFHTQILHLSLCRCFFISLLDLSLLIQVENKIILKFCFLNPISFVDDYLKAVQVGIKFSVAVLYIALDSHYQFLQYISDRQ